MIPDCPVQESISSPAKTPVGKTFGTCSAGYMCYREDSQKALRHKTDTYTEGGLGRVSIPTLVLPTRSPSTEQALNAQGYIKALQKDAVCTSGEAMNVQTSWVSVANVSFADMLDSVEKKSLPEHQQHAQADHAELSSEASQPLLSQTDSVEALPGRAAAILLMKTRDASPADMHCYGTAQAKCTFLACLAGCRILRRCAASGRHDLCRPWPRMVPRPSLTP